MKWENSLMAYEEDIKNRTLLDWLKAHTSGFKPLHRYEGVFELNEEKIVFDGKDIKEDKKFRLGIPIKSITDLYLGWDDIFTGFPMSRAGDRAYPWNKPLRVKYKSDLEERTIYLFVRFHRKWGIRASDNKEVYKKLKEILGGE
jgi:hypothetical protein